MNGKLPKFQFDANIFRSMEIYIVQLCEQLKSSPVIFNTLILVMD